MQINDMNSTKHLAEALQMQEREQQQLLHDQSRTVLVHIDHRVSQGGQLRQTGQNEQGKRRKTSLTPNYIYQDKIAPNYNRKAYNRRAEPVLSNQNLKKSFLSQKGAETLGPEDERLKDNDYVASASNNSRELISTGSDNYHYNSSE